MNFNQPQAGRITATINSFYLQCISGLFLGVTRIKPTIVPEEDFEILRLAADVTALQVRHQCEAQGAPTGDQADESEGNDIEFEVPRFVVSYICMVLQIAHKSAGRSSDTMLLMAAWAPFARAVVDSVTGSPEKSEEYMKERNEFMDSMGAES
jgi:hypothetical protein